jgi:acid phosphatase type 7
VFALRNFGSQDLHSAITAMSYRHLTLVALLTIAGAPDGEASVAVSTSGPGEQAQATTGRGRPSGRAEAWRRYPVVGAAGDIACPTRRPSSDGERCQQRATSNLFRRWRRAVILTLGDNQYERGTLSEFRRGFRPTWGRFRGRIRPSPGNHEYLTPKARGYFDYFGRRAGPRRRGYYSFDRGRWHIVSLNSECEDAGGCMRGSPQNRWLRRDLRRNSRFCTLAYWHHPRFSSGDHGNQEHVAPFWQALWRYRADVVLNGHDHVYERFAPQTPSGRRSWRGIRQWVVGTGGANHFPFGTIRRNSRARNWKSFGVLFLRLRPHSYTYRFVPAGDGSFRDSGTGRCH